MIQNSKLPSVLAAERKNAITLTIGKKLIKVNKEVIEPEQGSSLPTLDNPPENNANEKSARWLISWKRKVALPVFM